MQEHSKLGALWGWNPAQLQPIATISVASTLAPLVHPAPASPPGMPSRVRGSSDPKFNEDSMFLLMDKHVSKSQLRDAHTKGCLFGVKADRISVYIGYHECLLAASIGECREAFFRKLVVQGALERLNDRLPEDERIDGQMAIRLQAANFCKYTQQLRECKRTH